MEWIPCYSSVFYILTIKEAHALCLIADGEKAYSLDQSAKKAPVSSFFAILFRSLVSLILLIVPPPISSTVDAFLPSSPPPLALLSFCLSRTHSSEPFFTLQMAIVLLHTHTHVNIWGCTLCQWQWLWVLLTHSLTFSESWIVSLSNSTFTHSVCSWARVKAGCQSTNTGLTLHDWEKHFSGLVAIIATWLLGC